MKKGILLFAYNTEFNYVNLAVICAKRLKKYLGLPITLVTDNKKLLKETEPFDSIIELEDLSNQQKRFYNGIDSQIFTWKNLTRVYSYDLSPYDKTLVVDVDYIVNSNFLLKCMDLQSDFLIFKEYNDLAKTRKNNQFEYITDFGIPFYWATVFIFEKNKKNKIFFDLLKFIKENWDYYRLIYQISDSKFRNDFAFSIAIHIISGCITSSSFNIFPGKIHFVQDKDLLVNANENSLLFLIEDERCQTNYSPILVNNLDVHIMNKFSILEVLS